MKQAFLALTLIVAAHAANSCPAFAAAMTSCCCSLANK